MITIEVWSDINCPFCYIGKRNLEKAIDLLAEEKKVEIIWRSFELDPFTHPAKGEDSLTLLAKKYGRDLAWAKEMHQSVTMMAAKSGLDFHLESSIPANSFNAHRLIQLTKKISSDLTQKMVETLFSYKFTQGKDISHFETLIEAAQDCGMDEEQTKAALLSELMGPEVRTDEEMATAKGIRGVPHFVINNHVSFSGARSVEQFLEVINAC